PPACLLCLPSGRLPPACFPFPPAVSEGRLKPTLRKLPPACLPPASTGGRRKRTRQGTTRPASGDRHDAVIDRVPPAGRRLVIEAPRAALPRQGDVVRLADVVPLLLERVTDEAAGGGQDGCPLLLALGVEDVPLDVVHRHRVGRKQERV